MLQRSLVIAVACALAGPATAKDIPIQTNPAGGLDWETTAEGVAFAPLVGDRFHEPYMAMVRLPAGLISPAHTKTADMFGVMIQGTMTHSRHGDTDAATPLPEGSFYHIPADIPHVSACISDTDCVTFLYQDGKFDFLPVTQ